MINRTRRRNNRVSTNESDKSLSILSYCLMCTIVISIMFVKVVCSNSQDMQLKNYSTNQINGQKQSIPVQVSASETNKSDRSHMIDSSTEERRLDSRIKVNHSTQSKVS